MTGAGGTRLRSAARRALGFAALAPAAPLALVVYLYLRGNGPTWAGLALAGLLCAPLAASYRLLLSTRPAIASGALLFLTALGETAFVVGRLSRAAHRSPAVRMCVGRDCGGAGPWIARLPPERETALAGLELSGLLGAIEGEEKRALGGLLRSGYASLEASPRYEGLPSAPVAGILPGASRRSLQWVPPGKSRVPCIVFLHGFGGQLSVYIQALVESEIGREFVVVAPFEGPGGFWWSARGAEIVRRVIAEDLPDEVDRDRVYLMGLSNGAIGATELGAAAASPLPVRGVIALSGIGRRGQGERRPVPLLVIAGDSDPRFPFAYVQGAAEALALAGLPVELQKLAGDHFILLSQSEQVGRLVADWVRRQGDPKR